MSQQQLRLAAQSVFDVVRRHFSQAACAPGELLDASVPGEVRKALRELGVVDARGVVQWGLASVGGFLVAFAAGPPEEDRLSRLIPAETFDHILVLKAGAGLTALAASRRVRTVVAVENSPRARQLLEFHLRLNGITNVVVRAGAEEHARYPMVLIPNVEQEALEATLRPVAGGEKPQIRLLNKAISYLQPGGRLLANVTVSWRISEKMEAQVREWLPAASQCGVVFYEARSRSTVDFAVAMLRDAGADGLTLEDCLDKIERADSKSVSDGVLMVHQSGRPYFGHYMLTHPVDDGAIQRSWLWGGVEELLSSRPRLSANWKIKEPFRMVNGAFSAQRESLVTDTPFEAEFPFPPWLKTLLPLVDGQRTMQEIVSALEQEGVSRADALFGLEKLGSFEVIRVD